MFWSPGQNHLRIGAICNRRGLFRERVTGTYLPLYLQGVVSSVLQGVLKGLGVFRYGISVFFFLFFFLFVVPLCELLYFVGSLVTRIYLFGACRSFICLSFSFSHIFKDRRR